MNVIENTDNVVDDLIEHIYKSEDKVKDERQKTKPAEPKLSK